MKTLVLTLGQAVAILCHAAVGASAPLSAPAEGREMGKPAAKPNVLFILVDDLGWRDAGCYGRKEWRTPSIDRIAASGCRFTSAYAMPLCSPTRSMLLSGKHCVRFGITDWIRGFPPRPEQHRDGVSFAGVFRGEKSRRRTLQRHYPHFRRHTMGFPSGAIRRDDWKLIEWYGQTAENGKNRVELFNLAEDPGEQNDVADHFPKLRDSLLEELAHWRAETGAVMPAPRDRSSSSKP